MLDGGGQYRVQLCIINLDNSARLLEADDSERQRERRKEDSEGERDNESSQRVKRRCVFFLVLLQSVLPRGPSELRFSCRRSSASVSLATCRFVWP